MKVCPSIQWSLLKQQLLRHLYVKTLQNICPWLYCSEFFISIQFSRYNRKVALEYVRKIMACSEMTTGPQRLSLLPANVDNWWTSGVVFLVDNRLGAHWCCHLVLKKRVAECQEILENGMEVVDPLYGTNLEYAPHQNFSTFTTKPNLSKPTLVNQSYV